MKGTKCRINGFGDSDGKSLIPVAIRVGKLDFMGVVDRNGVMTGDFKIEDFDPGLVEDLLNSSDWRGAKEGVVVRAKVERYKVCDMRMMDYIPCLHNAEAIQKWNSSVRGEKYERHCPEEGNGLNCLVPMPQGYKIPILWPKSRDGVLFWLYNQQISGFRNPHHDSLVEIELALPTRHVLFEGRIGIQNKGRVPLGLRSKISFGIFHHVVEPILPDPSHAAAVADFFQNFFTF